jgi:hypothetical protein
VVGRLDTPGLGRRALEGAAGAAGEDAESLRVAAEELRDSLWELSALVGEKGGAGERKK